MKNRFLILFLFLTLGCVTNKIKPSLDLPIHEEELQKSAFKPLTDEEKASEWGKEYRIGKAFAYELDLYRAIGAFKSAKILIPKENPRLAELDYDILLSYYLGKKYNDVIDNFEKSSLSSVDKTFPAFHDLLVILYDSYTRIKEEKKAARILEVIQESFPGTYKKFLLSTALSSGNVEEARALAKSPPERSKILAALSDYEIKKKSIIASEFFNAIVPGTGYLYLGQKKSALTAFLINGLFIATAYEFIHRGYYAAGILTCGFEAGWYFGGIYGAGLEAKYYNERCFEAKLRPLLYEEKLTPALFLEYAF